MKTKNEPLTAAQALALREELRREGGDGSVVAARVGISKVALLRAAAGLPIMRGTRAVITSALGVPE